MSTLTKVGEKMAALLENCESEIAALTAERDELLDALKEVVRISDRKHDAWDKAKAAMARAEGRTP
jgi:hypothetical protein